MSLKLIKKSAFIALFLFLLLLIVLWLISPVRPVAWVPSPNTGLVDEFSPNDRLYSHELNASSVKQTQRLFLQGVGVGPEDIVISDDGYLFTAYADGRIIKTLVAPMIASFEKQNTNALQVIEFANTGGRPLGLKFDKQNNLIVADAERGLLSIDPQGNIVVLVDEVDGEPLKFVDHLAIGNDGLIWFSDASTRFDYHGFMYDFIEASSTGRLLSYDPDSAVTEVHLDGLFFANGVALSQDNSFVLINETGRARVHRLWLKGEKAGLDELFIQNLPAMPDNISSNNGLFWLPLIALRDPKVEALAEYPVLRRVIGGLPKSLLKASSSYGFVVALNEDGKIVYNLQSTQGYQAITAAVAYQGFLFLGSLDNDAIALIPLPQRKQ
jgi:sugar lactone lactonase YvrE